MRERAKEALIMEEKRCKKYLRRKRREEVREVPRTDERTRRSKDRGRERSPFEMKKNYVISDVSN